MKLGIKWRFMLGYLMLLVAGLGILDVGGDKIIYQRIVEQQTDLLYEEAREICVEYVPNIRVLETRGATLERQFRSLGKLTQTRIWVVSSAGEILLDSERKQSCKGENINSHDEKFLENQSLTGKRPAGLLEESVVSVIYPVTEWLETNGYVVAMKPDEEMHSRAYRYTDGLMVCYLAVMFLVGLVLLYLYVQSVYPLKKLTQATKKCADGSFDNLVVKKLPREQKEMADAINYLSDRVNTMNEYQKKFIANVSHDFRSPLTSIKGYVEAMADGTIPPEKQGKYLDIILFEVERLTKLTGNLLELNQLDCRGMTLDWSEFDINEAIKQTSASFEQRCREKRISLDLVFEKPICMVWGDMGKIQQVVQNILDNAIKFSHHDSVVEVHTARQSHKVFVSVKDHGIGIPKESISKVWSRFYKTDLSRGKDKTGTGLGLSITKEIVDAHGENINVISTEGVGTEFLFSLPTKRDS
ncbi:MAG: HAMP domain-containing histidine kinase [Lachnospiraceae bacterium]|nr:HAMP domain-containing histidine kinase [Lachnospiraceae bacterium]